jgi:hypothetical protein
VRGINEVDKRLKVRNLLRWWKANIICLQETKLKFISINIVRNLWGCLHASWCYLPSSGAFGGILLLWALSKMITATINKGFLLGFSVGSRPPTVNISLVVRG